MSGALNLQHAKERKTAWRSCHALNETYGGGILVVMEGDAAIPGVSGPQRGLSSGWLPMLLLAEA